MIVPSRRIHLGALKRSDRASSSPPLGVTPADGRAWTGRTRAPADGRFSSPFQVRRTRNLREPVTCENAVGDPILDWVTRSWSLVTRSWDRVDPIPGTGQMSNVHIDDLAGNPLLETG